MVKAIINLKNNDHKCFQFAITVALNYQNIKNSPERMTKIKPCINQINWKKISYHIKKSKSLNSNNKSIALNI